jgi:isopenicillin-N epimerase
MRTNRSGVLENPFASITLQRMSKLMNPPAPLRPNLRSEWMLKDGITFLNHGSFGALPRRVFDVQTDWRRRIEAEPIEMIGRRGSELIAQAKLPVGSQFGMDPDNFGFVTNATEGVNAVLRSLSLKPGDELLTTTHVYHAVRQAMKNVARSAGAVCREIDIPLPVTSPEQIRDLVLNALSSKTRLLVIDHVTSPTALVFPLAEIVDGCIRKGVEVLADGAHAPGMLPLNVEAIGATYYTANLHKWVCAPKGTAFLWVCPEKHSVVHPAVISHNLDSGLAREFAWQGTRDLSSWLSAPAAISFMGELGWDHVMAHNHQLATWAQQMLSSRWNVQPLTPLDGSLLGSMATVPLPGQLGLLQETMPLQQQLYDEFGLEQPLVKWEGRMTLRVSCQVYNNAADYEKLAEVLLKLSAE